MRESDSAFSGELKPILKNVSRTLYLSIAILPEPLRSLMALGYLIARAMDTVADCPALVSSDKRAILEMFKQLEQPGNKSRLLHAVGKLIPSVHNHKEQQLLCKLDKLADLYLGLKDHDSNIMRELVISVGNGMLMDVDKFSGQAIAALNSEEELKKYCALIGGAPGVFWAKLYREMLRRNNPGLSTLPSETDAELIGSALQITNILKDLSNDLKIGRCYLPMSELKQANLKPEDLLSHEKMYYLRPIVNKWIAWAVDQLDRSEAFCAAIPKTELALRAAFIWPVYWAMDSLSEIAKANLLDSQNRPKISKKRIYSTIINTPPMLLSNTAFAHGYRFRRETLILQIISPV